jgi:hypothetical protein
MRTKGEIWFWQKLTASQKWMTHDKHQKFCKRTPKSMDVREEGLKRAVIFGKPDDALQGSQADAQGGNQRANSWVFRKGLEK